MTGHFLLDWMVMAISLFNTMAMLWLGLTLALNAQRRTWGISLASGGLLTGAAFFASHSAILGRGGIDFGPGISFWWYVGWAAVLALPLAWYACMLWFVGFWEGRSSGPRAWHSPGLVLAALLAMGSAVVLVASNPLPALALTGQLDLSTMPAIGDVPLLVLVYPLYATACLGLSLHTLRRPGPVVCVMVDPARQRARPWLLTASLALLGVNGLVAWALRWLIQSAQAYARTGIQADVTFVIPFDLAIAALISAATLALGQAIVSYEVFTGRTLPRRGLRRHWLNALILAAGYGVVMGWTLVAHVRAVYALLLSASVLALFYALLTWRSYAEREQYINHLRPFVASERLYERVTAWPSAEMDPRRPFSALCDDVLGATTAYLIAHGPMASLAGAPLAYGNGTSAAPPSIAEIATCVDSPQTMCMPVDPARHGGATWAVPLWSERGLIGVLLLGPKRDGGLYTQEEIEIARASGERLIDTYASAEMARRLMALQRQRMVESQVLDRRARRALHDDVLPRLHAALLALSGQRAEGRAPNSEATALLMDVHRQLSDLLRDMPSSHAPEVARSGLFRALHRVVDDELAHAFDEIVWHIEPEAQREASQIPPLTAEVLFYAAREAVRNAARHGRDVGRPFQLEVTAAWQDGMCIVIRDNGMGLVARGSAESSTGQGLALHGTMMAVVGGSLAVESVPEVYTSVSLSLPMMAYQRLAEGD